VRSSERAEEDRRGQERGGRQLGKCLEFEAQSQAKSWCYEVY